MQASVKSLRQVQSIVIDWSSCLCRKAFQLLRELVRQCPQDIREAVKQGLFRTLVSAIRSDLADVREAALALLALLVQHPGVVTAAKEASSTSLELKPPFGLFLSTLDLCSQRCLRLHLVVALFLCPWQYPIIVAVRSAIPPAGKSCIEMTAICIELLRWSRR